MATEISDSDDLTIEKPDRLFEVGAWLRVWRWSRRFCAVLVLCVMTVYIISFAPFLLLFDVMEDDASNDMMLAIALEIFYLPLIILMRIFPPFEAFVTWEYELTQSVCELLRE